MVRAAPVAPVSRGGVEGAIAAPPGEVAGATRLGEIAVAPPPGEVAGAGRTR